MLEIKDLEVQYQDNSVLNQLNLKIEEGEVFGVLGKNGAGKTSLFESIFQSKCLDEMHKKKIYFCQK